MIQAILLFSWHELGANIATMISAVAIIFVIVEYLANKNIRNIQLMQRCIDIFREWQTESNKQVDLAYLELLNEELFYFQKGLIDKKVAVEWIEGIVDFIQVRGRGGIILNDYSQQTDLRDKQFWNDKKYFFARIDHFCKTEFDAAYVIPAYTENEHSLKKRKLAEALYKHIKDYKY